MEVGELKELLDEFDNSMEVVVSKNEGPIEEIQIVCEDKVDNNWFVIIGINSV